MRLLASAMSSSSPPKLGVRCSVTPPIGMDVSVASAERIKKQVADAGAVSHPGGWHTFSRTTTAVKAGAKALIPEDLFPIAKGS